MYIELALGGLCLTALKWSCLDVTFYSLVEAAAKYIRNVIEKQSHCVPQLMQQHSGPRVATPARTLARLSVVSSDTLLRS